ncbi:hypothetical protein OYT1_ch2465 [Ferriphaselus amnicola]|uniref:Uncharacterized protein n=1 Tax=Ferriphaselus amnicola TaxID=1188319 RepID=A0A2Z6GEI6_9PROT|nr:hypothetical protein [Ferriphaselus amnicola]BBE51978.1 hypothetical protein OYT1_ch2465 [Ferriphaselus amnicola]
MSDKLKTELDAIFNSHAETKKQIEHQKSEREVREEAFVQSFYGLRDSLIRPTFERIGEYIKAKGYKYHIETSEEQTDPEGRYQSPSISIRFLVGEDGSHYRSHEYPHLSVICEKGFSKLRFHESTISPGRGGHAGGAGDATPTELTADLINQKVLKVIREVFK